MAKSEESHAGLWLPRQVKLLELLAVGMFEEVGINFIANANAGGGLRQRPNWRGRLGRGAHGENDTGTEIVMVAALAVHTRNRDAAGEKRMAAETPTYAGMKSTPSACISGSRG